MCRFTIVSKNAYYYYYWLKNKDSGLVETTKEYLKNRIKVIFEDSREIYGSHRTQKKLEREVLTYCRSYIYTFERNRLKSIFKRKFVVTKASNHAFPIKKNILK
jgi:hypothetical protein